MLKINEKILNIFADRVSMGGDAIASVRLAVLLFPLYLSNRLTISLDLLRVRGSLPWLTGD